MRNLLAIVLLAFGLTACSDEKEETTEKVKEAEQEENGESISQTSNEENKQFPHIEKFADETYVIIGEHRILVKVDHVSDYISHFHSLYNEKTGWQTINSISWKEQRLYALAIIRSIPLVKVDDHLLKKDFENIKEMAKAVVVEAESNSVGDNLTVRFLHRLFHDLDIKVNGYQSYDKYYGYTYKGGGTNTIKVETLLKKYNSELSNLTDNTF